VFFQNKFGKVFSYKIFVQTYFFELLNLQKHRIAAQKIIPLLIKF